MLVAALVHVAVVELVAGKDDQIRMQSLRFRSDALDQPLSHDRADVQVRELHDAVGSAGSGLQVHVVVDDPGMGRVDRAVDDDADAEEHAGEDHPGAEMRRLDKTVQGQIDEVAQHDHGRAVHQQSHGDAGDAHTGTVDLGIETRVRGKTLEKGQHDGDRAEFRSGIRTEDLLDGITGPHAGIDAACDGEHRYRPLGPVVFFIVVAVRSRRIVEFL